MKYSEIISVGKHFKSAFDVVSDRGEAWKAFISNERFEHNLSQIITSFTSPSLDKRKSIWIQGTYGTGKSHSLSVIKHLLSDDFETIADYIPKLKRSQLRGSITSFRKNKRVFPVVLKGVHAITDIADLTYTIQHQVAKALNDKAIQISTKTDFDSLLQIMQNESLDSFFSGIIEKNVELRSYAANKSQLIRALKNYDIGVLRLVSDEMKAAGLGSFRTHNIVDWLAEVRRELKRQGIADCLLIIWDEFTNLLEIPARRSILNVMQDIAELSYSESEDDPSDTLGVYLILVTHKRLEATETYKELKEDERNMAQARFTELDYGMQPTTTFHILSGALNRKQPKLLDELIQKNLMNAPSVRMIVDQIVDSDAVNASEIKEKVISLYPFHPYTSYLATFVSRVIGEAERSIFEFLNDEEKGFKKFIETDIDEKKFLTADYVWDFFYETFEKNAAFGFIINRFKLASASVASQSEEYSAVFKTILLLNILYRVATTDGDASEKSMVNPSTKNIIAAFSGVLNENEVLTILDYLDEKQILHRNPDGIFEISSSALPSKKILEAKKNLYPNKEDVSKIVEEYSIKCVGELRKILSRGISRELDAQMFWGGEKEYLLRDKILAKFKTGYTLNVAVMLYRGQTPMLDSILGRSEVGQIASKDMLLNLSKEEEFRNIIFVLVNTELGNRRFEAYLDSLAQESVARVLQMNEERIEGEQNAEKWIAQWIDDIKNSGMTDILFRGDAIRVPFSQCSKYMKGSYIRAIFRYGLDFLPAADTEWNHQTSKKAVELVLYADSKDELEKNATGNDKAVCRLLSDGSEILFNDRLELISSDERIPIVKLFQEVKRVFEKNKNESSINLAEEFRYFTQPEYGYYRNRLFMGALALAMRPYVDRLYTSGSGQRVDKILMREIVVSIFVYWEDSKKFNDRFVVRMSTEEERALTNKLNVIFGITNQDGLLNTKWAIRTKFQNQSQSPLWSLKYVGDHQDAYKAFIDKMFKFSNSTDESIQKSFIIELLEGIKTFDIELTSDLARVEDVRCLDNYILRELEELHEPAGSLELVKAYLDDHLSGEVAFWEEEDVHEKILMWKIHNQERRGQTEEKPPAGSEQSAGTYANASAAQNPATVEDLQERVRKKIKHNREDSTKLYQILMLLVDRHSNILEDIENFL